MYTGIKSSRYLAISMHTISMSTRDVHRYYGPMKKQYKIIWIEYGSVERMTMGGSWVQELSSVECHFMQVVVDLWQIHCRNSIAYHSQNTLLYTCTIHTVSSVTYFTSTVKRTVGVCTETIIVAVVGVMRMVRRQSSNRTLVDIWKRRCKT